MNKVFIFLMCFSVCLLFVICDLNKEEGADCEWEGIKGKCVPSRKCLTSLDDGGDKPPVCSHTGDETIICCTDCELVNDTSNFILSPSLRVFWKDGRKARDACLQYLKKLPHKCHQDGYSSRISRTLDKENNCHFISTSATLSLSPPGMPHPFTNPYEAIIGFGENRDLIMYMAVGVIISERFVLSSAHQVRPILNNIPPKFIAVGTTSLDQKDWDPYVVKRVHNHPQYNRRRRYHDIALLELETPLIFKENILPACLPDPVEEFDTSTAQFTTTMRKENEVADSPRPYVMEVQEFPIEVCITKINSVMYVPNYYREYLPQGAKNDTHVCYGKDKCLYVIEAPLSVTTQYSDCLYTVVGVTVYGRHNCAPSIFTKVKRYTPWIESIVWP